MEVRGLTSVVIAAHNEEAVLGRCLDSLAGAGAEVIVVANGCTDGTAGVARVRGVRVIERAEPSKPGALNAGDAVATSFPRLYLDADVVLAPDGLDSLARALAAPGVLAAVPRRDMDTAGRPWPVRAYYTVHSRLPAVQSGLYGRGAIALSAAGRARFAEFPEMTADDLYLDSLFKDGEKVVVSTVGVRVAAPTRTGDLVRRLSRVRAGNAAMRSAVSGARRSRRFSWLTDVVRRSPGLAPAAVCYVVLTVTAALLARRGGNRWARDESSRGGAA